MENEAKELLVEGRNCIIIWKKKLWLIIAMAILGLVAGNLITMENGANEYIATAKITSYTVTGEHLVACGSLVTSLGYCEQAAEMLNDGFVTTERIHNNASVIADKNTRIIKISVRDADKAMAVKIVNALTKVTVNEINEKLGADSVQILESGSANIYSNAVIKSLLLKFGCMFLAAVATIVVLGVKAITSKKIVLVEDFTCGGELAIIGMIPLYED